MKRKRKGVVELRLRVFVQLCLVPWHLYIYDSLCNLYLKLRLWARLGSNSIVYKVSYSTTWNLTLPSSSTLLLWLPMLPTHLQVTSFFLSFSVLSNYWLFLSLSLSLSAVRQKVQLFLNAARTGSIDLLKSM